MKGLRALVLFGSPLLLVYSIPMHHIHLRQLQPALQITWVTSSSTAPLETTTTIYDTVARRSSAHPAVATQPDDMQTQFVWPPPLLLPLHEELLSVSVSTTVEIVSEMFTTTVYEQPVTTTLTASPTTITQTITVSEPFTATPGSFWAAPVKFSSLDSFKIAHFACGEKNLQITDGVPPDTVDDSLAVNLRAFGGDISYGKVDSENSSSALLQLLYPQDSINPGNSPQGGADFYATPLPLGDASNVTLEYSVFFPKGFDWVQGGKLPGLYGGHMTCSGGDDATSCFSTRLMWRAGGAGELYLYAPKDKQTFSLCHAPPHSVCDAAYGLSIGRGSFTFTPGAWTNVRQTVSLNTPGEHDGGFGLEVNGKLIMDRHDVFYRDHPSATTSSAGAAPTSGDGDEDSDDGGLLSPLLGSVLKPAGVFPPLGKSNGHSSSDTSAAHSASGHPPLLPFEQPFTEIFNGSSTDNNNGTTLHSEFSAISNSRPTITQIVPQATVTISNYLWAHAFGSNGKEVALSGVTSSGPEPISFSGLFFSTFFGGNSDEYATPIDQYSWFKDFSITINS